MRVSIFVWIGLVGLLTGCGLGPNAAEGEAFFEDLPPAVAEIADPRQNLEAVTIDPIDGCFVYQYVGPVETTLLPLRTVEGRPICGPAPEEAEAEA